MTRTILSLVLAAVISIIVAPARAQQAPTIQTSQQPGSYSLQVNSQIVVLDVVVNNKKGESVSNLTRDDFKVYENKVPQTILSFEPAIQPGAHATAPIPIASTADLDRQEPNAPVSIIVLDEVTTNFEDEAFARYSLKKYLNGQGDTLRQPTMLIAVNFRNMMVLRDYTTSRKEILDALDRHFAGYNWKAVNGAWTSEQLNAAFASLIEVARATAGHPGHKNMIWVGRGFPSFRWDKLFPNTQEALRAAIANCANILRDSRVTLYAIDPAGLSAAPPPVDEDGFYVEEPFGGQVDFDTMAQATGGQSFHGRNDVDRLISTGVNDGETFYTLTYKPTTVSQDPKDFRLIQVLLSDRSLRASTREGYFATAAPIQPALDATGKPSKQLTFDIDVAGQGLLVFDGVPLTITRDPAAPDTFHLHVSASSLTWQQDPSRKMQQSEMTVFAASFDKKGKSLSRRAQLMTVQLPPLPAGVTADNRSVTVPLTIATAPPAARLRFVVRSNGNGRIGADNVFLVDRKSLSDPATGLKAEHPK